MYCNQGRINLMIIIFSLGDFAGVVIQNKPFQVYREQYHEGGGC